MASWTAAVTSTRRGSWSVSATWSRDRSTISLTSWASRWLSTCMREAKRSTASGSSSRPGSPRPADRVLRTGVLSSWLTFATKSRRTSSTALRLGVVLHEQQHVAAAQGRHRACMIDRAWPSGSRASSSWASRITPSRRTCRARWRSSLWTSSLPLTRPSGRRRRRVVDRPRRRSRPRSPRWTAGPRARRPPRSGAARPAGRRHAGLLAFRERTATTARAPVSSPANPARTAQRWAHPRINVRCATSPSAARNDTALHGRTQMFT